jgi:hypothetical protein
LISLEFQKGAAAPRDMKRDMDACAQLRTPDRPFLPRRKVASPREAETLRVKDSPDAINAGALEDVRKGAIDSKNFMAQLTDYHGSPLLTEYILTVHFARALLRAQHENLYDRRSGEMSLDEVERVVI